ncbi:hypothetical protein [Actinoplanes sp. NPDC023714]|uniref:hypothetical protein n=1 Tax=Actinoplanes sp. NPDC023714 TaxID=3154322 RepID=UPI0033E22CFE
MLWPILTSEVPWSPGDHVTIRLRWRDDPSAPGGTDGRVHAGLPGRLEVTMRATILHDPDGVPWAQLLRKDGVSAARTGHTRSGEVQLSGCLTYESYEQWDQVPPTTGVVRRIRAFQLLHDRGADFWVPRPGIHRLIDILPGADSPADEDDVDPATLRLLSPEEYFALARDHLPQTEWQTQAYLTDLDVPGS